MLELQPVVRLLAATSCMTAAFLVWRPELMLALYGIVLIATIYARVVATHVRFVGLVGLPLLAALVFIWVFIVHPPSGSTLSGPEYACSLWLRILVLSGSLQWLLLPLVERPLYLRAFISVLRLPTGFSALLMAPVITLPEIRRRVARIIDARKAQGLPSRRLAGLLALPSMMGPLVASLLESSIARSELWTHRALLAREQEGITRVTYAPLQSIAVLTLSLAVLCAAAMLRS